MQIPYRAYKRLALAPLKGGGNDKFIIYDERRYPAEDARIGNSAIPIRQNVLDSAARPFYNSRRLLIHSYARDTFRR